MTFTGELEMEGKGSHSFMGLGSWLAMVRTKDKFVFILRQVDIQNTNPLLVRLETQSNNNPIKRQFRLGRFNWTQQVFGSYAQP